MGNLSVPKIAVPLDETNARASEKQLGFALPSLLTQLYSSIGNGGFGPGYGMLGVMGGAADDQGHNAVEAYALYSSADPHDSAWHWPKGLLPICHWGCAIYSCIDCSSENKSIVTFDPNLHDTSWSQCFVPTEHSLETWLDAWARGVRLWDEMYPDAIEP